MRLRTLATISAVLSSGLLAGTPSARACGGFFCNNQAIDQSGENILFSFNADGSVTTVVQILYQGPSEEFAWILPVPAEPEVDVGTDALFQRLASATAPRFQLDYQQTGTCRSAPDCYDYWSRDEDTAFPGPAQDAAAAPGADAGAGAVDVRLRANVGPYDVAVLAANGSADALRDWLDENGYLIPDAAGAELDHYVALDHFFVALRLQKNRSAGEIQPIVLRSSNDEPCIPIRLTRIATVPDMPITAYFLAERRARPMNFMLVSPDLDDFGLWTGETSYVGAVTRAVNDVGGHAFVTDYAGDVPTFVLTLPSIEDLRTVDDPAQFLRELQGRGFTGDSQLLSLLTTFIPPPADYDPQTFYNCLIQSWCAGDVAAHLETIGFSPGSLVDAIDEAIIQPRNDAQAMLDAHSHLTRLFTTMSADEMTVDPEFMLSEELPREHGNVHTATVTTQCSREYFDWTAPQTLTLPSGATRALREGVAYLGTDDEYCEDRYGGDFHPGTPTERLREIASARGVRPGGGGAMCAVRPGSGSLAALGLLGLALALRVARRRPDRR